MKTPIVNVGIMNETTVSFILHGNYQLLETGAEITGEQLAEIQNEHILVIDSSHEE